MRRVYEVRIRVQVSPGEWTKKSKFYNATSPADAGSKYRGPGEIMTVEKVQKERLWGVGEFFTLGDKLLQELSSPISLETEVRLKDKVRSRRFVEQQRRLAEKI